MTSVDHKRRFGHQPTFPQNLFGDGEVQGSSCEVRCSNLSARHRGLLPKRNWNSSLCPPVWNPGAPYEIEMIGCSEDKLPACHDARKLHSDDLEGHPPPRDSVWIFNQHHTEPGPFRARALRSSRWATGPQASSPKPSPQNDHPTDVLNM